MIFKAKLVRIRESTTFKEVMKEIYWDTVSPKENWKRVKMWRLWTLALNYAFCIYLLFLWRIFKSTGFEEWVLLIWVIIHPFTEVISNVKSSEKEIKTKPLNIYKLAIWGFFKAYPKSSLEAEGYSEFTAVLLEIENW